MEDVRTTSSSWCFAPRSAAKTKACTKSDQGKRLATPTDDQDHPSILISRKISFAKERPTINFPFGFLVQKISLRMRIMFGIRPPDIVLKADKPISVRTYSSWTIAMNFLCRKAACSARIQDAPTASTLLGKFCR